MTARHRRRENRWPTSARRAGRERRRRGEPVPGRPGRRRVPLVLQTTLTDCAPACLAMILAAHGRPASLEQLREELGAGRDGVPAIAVRDSAARRGVLCRTLRVEASKLHNVPTPFIAHWEGNHFVVVDRVDAREVVLADPALGRRRFTRQRFSEGYSGVVQVFVDASPTGTAPTAAVKPIPAWRRILAPIVRRHRGALAVLAITAALLLLAGLITPALTSAIVGRLAGGADHPGLDVATVGVAGIVLTAAVGGLSLLRGLAAATIQEGVGRDLTGSLVTRLLAAPLLFFEHRGRGDIVSRVFSTEAIRDAVATHLVAAVLDSLAAIGYLAVVLFLDPTLGLVTAALAALQLLVLGTLAVRLRRLRREELQAEAKCHSWLMEAVAGIAWLKAAGAESDVHRRWIELHEERLAGLRRTARLGAVADAVAATVRTVGPLVVLLVAAASVARASAEQDGATVGTAVGLAALATAALLPFSSLAGHLRSFQELGSVVSHLGDLITAPTEQVEPRPPAPVLAGEIQGRHLSFRHHDRAPWVVHDVDIAVRRGAKIAIIGPSGSGKSTLARLLVGLYPPTAGEVLLDGKRLEGLNLAAVRRQIGVVLQEPFLVTGSLRENIALRRPNAALEDVIKAARLADVHDAITQMPSGYNTLVTEGGVGLSGGQRQRIALARALLDHPTVLVLDEATSHLDAPTEARIEANMRHLGVTRIVVAHRLSTIRDADQILVMNDGRIVEQGTHESLVDQGGHYAELLTGPPIDLDNRALTIA